MTKAKYKNPFMATMNGIIDLFRKQTPIGELNDTERLDGKTCLVTGANSGLVMPSLFNFWSEVLLYIWLAEVKSMKPKRD